MSSSEASIDELSDDVSSKFWTIFFFYILVSVGWTMYCCISHRKQMENVEMKIQKNEAARQLELQRLLEAYHNIGEHRLTMEEV